MTTGQAKSPFERHRSIEAHFDLHHRRQMSKNWISTTGSHPARGHSDARPTMFARRGAS
jgi:hypothetical protein